MKKFLSILAISSLLATCSPPVAFAQTLGPFTGSDGVSHLYTCYDNVAGCAALNRERGARDGFITRPGTGRGHDDTALIAGAVIGALIIGGLIFDHYHDHPIPKVKSVDPVGRAIGNGGR